MELATSQIRARKQQAMVMAQDQQVGNMPKIESRFDYNSWPSTVIQKARKDVGNNNSVVVQQVEYFMVESVISTSSSLRRVGTCIRLRCEADPHLLVAEA